MMEEEFSPDMISWITPEIAISNFWSAHQKELLAEHAIKAVLCLDAALSGDAATERGLDVLSIVGLVDGPNERWRFEQALSVLSTLVKKYGRVLVHCRAGKSRSIAVVAAYLVKKFDLEPEQALRIVIEKRGGSAIAPELEFLVRSTLGRET